MSAAPPLYPAALRVFGFLCRNADEDGNVEASTKEIALGTGLDGDHVWKHVKRLKARAMIQVISVTLPKPIGKVSNVYAIDRDAVSAELARQDRVGESYPTLDTIRAERESARSAVAQT